MTRLELLASQLDMEALTPEIQAPQRTFSINMSFWNLCMQARRERNAERGKNDTNKKGRSTEVAS